MLPNFNHPVVALANFMRELVVLGERLDSLEFHLVFVVEERSLLLLALNQSRGAMLLDDGSSIEE